MQLKQEKESIEQQIKTLQLDLRNVECELQNYTEYIVEKFHEDISQENTPYIYHLLSMIKNFKQDDRKYLKWGRGKNIVDYEGWEFEYKNIKYTAGYANNWCSDDIFFTYWDDAHSKAWSIEYDYIYKMREIDIEDDISIAKIDKYLSELKIDHEDEYIYKISILIVFIFTEFGC